MSHQPESDMGSDWETRVQKTAQQFIYPPTPDVHSKVITVLAEQDTRSRHQPVRARRLAWIALVLLIVLGALMLVPDVRANVLKLLRIGSVRISLDGSQPEAVATLPPLVLPDKPGQELAGRTTLEEARAVADFPIRYPPDLGEPDYVYVQHAPGVLVILVWVDPDDPSRAKVSLHLLGRGMEAFKGTPLSVEETTVHGQRAIWATGPYMLIYAQGMGDIGYVVEGHVLVWAGNGITYRLETDLSLSEAVQLAESMN